ncbi:MAG: hypothetical protein U1F87_18520 [Kiritimatiellia bacterium]
MTKSEPIDFHCPSCGRLVYNRKADTCGYCRATLPTALRIDPEVAGRWDAARQKRKAEKERWAKFDNRPASRRETGCF